MEYEIHNSPVIYESWYYLITRYVSSITYRCVMFCSSQSAEAQEKVKTVVSEECSLVTLVDVSPGKFEVTNTFMYFFESSNKVDEGK